jgi:hypothetical protein
MIAMDKKILFVVVSKDEQYGLMKNTLDQLCLNGQFDCKWILNNRKNLTVVYNEILNSPESLNYKAVVLLHADVKVDINSLCIHIFMCYDKYDVMGLCGCDKISVSESPLNWFCGSRKYPENRWGIVTHGEMDNKTSFFNIHSPNFTDHHVSCIDGLCIILTQRAIKAGLRFDEQLRFNCYDTQISFDAIIKFKMKLGCLVEKSLVHHSVGKSILSDDFLEDEIILRKRFGFDIPPNSKIEQLINKKKLCHDKQ